MIHFNNAGASLPPPPVTAAITGYLEIEAHAGGYETAARFKKQADDFYTQVGRLLSAKPENIAFVTNATEGYTRALTSIPWRAGDLVLCTRYDYVSNHITLRQLADRFGIQVEILAGGDGPFDPEILAARLADFTRPRPRLLSVTHVPTNHGLVQDVVAAGRLAREYDLLYLVDACQAAGQLPLDVREIQCDFLSATFRKYLRGSRGTGFLYVSDRILAGEYAPLGLDLHAARWTGPATYQPAPTAARFETWERSYALIMGAAAAAKYANDRGLTVINQRITHLAEYLRTAILTQTDLQVLETGPLQTGILHAIFPAGTDPAELLEDLRRRQLNTSISYGEYDQINYTARNLKWALRLSVHYYNTEEEIDRAILIITDSIN